MTKGNQNHRICTPCPLDTGEQKEVLIIMRVEFTTAFETVEMNNETVLLYERKAGDLTIL